jgi:hypothetical protein
MLQSGFSTSMPLGWAIDHEKFVSSAARRAGLGAGKARGISRPAGCAMMRAVGSCAGLWIGRRQDRIMNDAFNE